MKNFFIFVCLVVASSCAPKDWGTIKNPSGQNPQIYGGYAAGCMDGAVALPANGTGYHLVNGQRNRFYGQPALVEFLQTYAAAEFPHSTQTLAISDLSQPRGGPLHYGHTSHQTGLDADIWYGSARGLPIELVQPDGTIDEKIWKNFDTRKLQNAANYPQVERIFVNPAIKAKLCSTHKGEAWLSKIRPWWGHGDHFHLRLSCPTGSTTCVPQAPLDKTDGCDATLDWWFSKEATKSTASSAPKKPKAITLPKQCDAVYEWKPEAK